MNHTSLVNIHIRSSTGRGLSSERFNPWIIIEIFIKLKKNKKAHNSLTIMNSLVSIYSKTNRRGVYWWDFKGLFENERFGASKKKRKNSVVWFFMDALSSPYRISWILFESQAENAWFWCRFLQLEFFVLIFGGRILGLANLRLHEEGFGWTRVVMTSHKRLGTNLR